MIISKKEKIYLILMLFVMLAIFLFSAQNAEDSAQISDTAYENMDGMLRDSLPGMIVDFIQDNFRKFAHFFLYMLLGINSFGVVSEHMGDRIKAKLSAEFALCICVVYAMTDELHQRFVPGRSCEWRDVCIDCLGAVLGIAILAGMRIIRDKGKRESSSI